MSSIKIINKTRNTLVTSKCKYVTAFVELIFGLHWLSNPPELLFKTRFGIHTLLLAKEIDVLVLDNKFKVVKIKERLNPNSLFFWNPKYKWVLELPKNAIKSSKTKLGDQFSFDPKP